MAVPLQLEIMVRRLSPNGVTLSAGVLTVPAGVTSFTVTLPTVDDTTIESSETVPLTVGGVQEPAPLPIMILRQSQRMVVYITEEAASVVTGSGSVNAATYRFRLERFLVLQMRMLEIR